MVAGFGFRLRRNGLAPGTVVKYGQALRDFLDWLPAGDDPAQATRATIERYLDEYAASGCAASTLRVRISGLQSFYDYLESLELVATNPCVQVKRPARQERAIDYLTPAEDKAILEAAVNPQEGILIALLRWTGMRISEACALRWTDVDRANRCLSVRASKTQSGIRTITLLAEMVRELDSWERYCRERGLYQVGSYVLATRTGRPMAPQFAWRLVKRVATRAGVRVQEASDKSGVNTSAISAHTFRRTLATDLLNRGLRLEVVSGELGHKDTRVTLAHYAQLQDSVRRDEVLRAYGEQA